MKVSTTQYAKTLLELTEDKSQQEVLDVTQKFAEKLKNDGQLKNAPRIMEKFSELYNAAHRVVEAQVITRYKIQDIRYEEIEDFIKMKYKAEKVEMTNIVDESIGGGLIIKVGDEVLDSSITAQLKKLQNILSK